jgi:NAD(P)H dehydrogenase (quinone)
MFALSVVGHPSPMSFSHKIAERAVRTLREQGVEVSDHDLYAEGYEPVRGADALVMKHRAELAAADILLICHPNWWSMPPAMLKGWIDRTFVPEVAYREAPIGEPPIGLLTARALVFNTGDTPPEREQLVFGDPMQRIWETGVLGFCGIRTVTRRMYGPVTSSSPTQREAWLDEVTELVAEASRQS